MTRSGDPQIPGGAEMDHTPAPLVVPVPPLPLRSPWAAPGRSREQPPWLLLRRPHHLVNRFPRIGRILRPLPCDPRNQVDNRPLANLSLCHCRPPMDLIVGDGCSRTVRASFGL